MGTTSSKLTVYFDDPFWVGVFERDDGKRLESAKVVFGAEPRDCEVYAFFLENYSRLRFSPPVKSAGAGQKTPGFKRMMRAAQKILDEKGIGTKAQQALKLQHEQTAKLCKVESRQKNEREEQRKLELNRQKKKEKHRGH
jgi:hypothetical protein